MLTIYFACQKDDAVPSEQNAERKIPKIETISYEDSKNTIFNNLKAKYNLDNHKASRFSNNIQAKSTMDTLGLIIETDIIKQVTLGNYTSYTMKIVDNDSTVFYNLTIEYKDGSSDLFVTKYTPSDYWLNNKNEVYDGEVQSKRIDEFTYYSEVDDIFDETAIPNGEPGGPDPGTGIGGGSYNPNYSPYYPVDCNGIVLITYEEVPFPCGCGDWDRSECTGCKPEDGFPMWPGVNEIPMYYCQEGPNLDDNDPSDPVDTNGPGGQDPDPIPDDPAITVTIKPEECLERIPGDLDGNCILSTYESCLLGGGRKSVCDCIEEGGTYEECKEVSGCDELKALSNDQEFMGKMTDLNTMSTTVNKEVGYIQKVDTTAVSGYGYDYTEESEDVDDEMNFTIPSSTVLKGYFHTHDDLQKHSPVFSIDDLYFVFSLFNPSFNADGSCLFNNVYNIEEDFTMILITVHGTKLALKFDSNGREQLRQFGEKYFSDWDIDLSEYADAFGALDTDRKRITKKFDEIVNKDLSIDKQKKKLAKFLDKVDFGMSLYQANDDFTEWEKINKSGDPIPCN